ncbi:MAG: HEAT repeat domain-containing protein [Limisphaerales bacterium]
MSEVLSFLKPEDYGNLHFRAAIELGARGPAASNAVGALVWAAGTQDQKYPRVAVEELLALGRIGPAARRAVPDLLKWLPSGVPGSSPSMLGRGAAWALVRIAPEDEHVAAALLDALARCPAEDDYAYIAREEFKEPIDTDRPSGIGRHHPPSNRRNLIRAIGKLRPQTPRTLAALFDQLDHGDYGAQTTAADVLGELRPVSRDTLGELKAALLRARNERPPINRDLLALATPWMFVRARSQAAPQKYWPTASRMGQPDPLSLVYFPEDPEQKLRRAFGRLWEVPAMWFETIFVPGEGFPGWGLRLSVIRALGRIGPPAEELLPLLLEECGDATNPARFDAAVAVWRIKGESPEVAGILEQELHAADPEARRIAVACLREMSATSPKALLLLIEGLRDPALQIRLQVVRSLASLGTNAIPALPALRALTNDQYFAVRIVATQAIQVIRPPTRARRE